jgi:acyl-coenzyme A thioesterase PaaI-like protein
MLIAGVCNPRGEADGYNGLYLTRAELEQVAASMKGTPVKAEHSGAALGAVVSSYIDAAGALNCVVRLDDSVEGEIVRGLVRDGIASDFSLGYRVNVSQSQHRLLAGEKTVLEVSVVRRGARRGCHIMAYTADPGDTLHVRRDPWFAFNLH